MTVGIVLALTASIAAACDSGGPSREDRMPPQDTSETTADNNVVNEALAFGSIVLPADAKVLAAASDKGIDQLYTLAIEVDPTSVDTLLAQSKFTTPLSPGRKVFMEPAQGFDPNTSTDIASAQDRLPPQGERAHAVTREILIDRGSEAKTIVHIWLFTT